MSANANASTNVPANGTYGNPTTGGESKLSTQPSLVVSSHRTPHPFFKPTHLEFNDRHSGEAAGTWTSRRARKGRYATKKAHVHYAAAPDKSASGAGAAEQGRSQSEMQRMESMAYARVQSTESRLKPGLKADISFWVAVAFTFGSAVWVVNGMSHFLPPSSFTPEFVADFILYVYCSLS